MYCFVLRYLKRAQLFLWEIFKGEPLNFPRGDWEALNLFIMGDIGGGRTGRLLCCSEIFKEGAAVFVGDL